MKSTGLITLSILLMYHLTQDIKFFKHESLLTLDHNNSECFFIKSTSAVMMIKESIQILKIYC